MAIAPAKTAISDTYPNPSNAVARAGFASLYDWLYDALGSNSSAAPQAVASAATVDLSAVTATRQINITGTTTITAFTIEIGKVFYVKATGAFTLTNNASIVTGTGANITTAANDAFMVRATAANIVEIIYIHQAGGATTNTAQTFTAPQRGTITTDNDGSFDLSVTNNFFCTPTGIFTLTFTNHTSGQSGFILLDNSGGYAISAAATTKVDANFLATVSTAGVYLISYLDNGTNAYCVASGALS